MFTSTKNYNINFCDYSDTRKQSDFCDIKFDEFSEFSGKPHSFISKFIDVLAKNYDF